jgi:thiamine-monophosphate kinase
MFPGRTKGRALSSEFELIRWFRAHSSASSGATVLGIGDDCALLQISPGVELVVTTDMLMEGRHFILDEAGPEAVGHKAMGVNLSDIAAMAARPLAAVVAVGLPRRDGRVADIAKGLHQGMATLAARFGVALIGGDTNAWDGPLVINVTLLGETTARGAVRRSGARAGDAILVTGPLGGSLLRRHLRPEPRIEEALALHEAVDIHALIDLSDGLSSDLGHILEESGGVGAILEASALPIHDDARLHAAKTGRAPLDHVLNDGEDFELCLTLAAEDADRLLAAPPPPARLFRVGTIIAQPGLWLRDENGNLAPLQSGGFDHLM